MEMVYKAWVNVSAQTVMNCFKVCSCFKEKQGVSRVFMIHGEVATPLLSARSTLEEIFNHLMNLFPLMMVS